MITSGQHQPGTGAIPHGFIGPPSADVGHCRANLFSYGAAAMERFTQVWEGLTGVSYDPWADVVTIVGFLDSLREEVPQF